MKQILNLEDFAVPIHIYIEKRNGSRISLLKEKINVRLPYHFSAKQRKSEIKKLLNWARKRLAVKNIYDQTTLSRNYWIDKRLKIYDKDWELEYVNQQNGRKFSAVLNENASKVFFYGCFESISIEENNKITRKLLIDIFKKHHLIDIINLVSEINDKTLKANYNKVSLKYINSRWGSCSMKGNINISLRLLFAPKEVLEYVILHELCHLEEMNHSSRFWSLVQRFMPDYKAKERWLKQNGHLCDF